MTDKETVKKEFKAAQLHGFKGSIENFAQRYYPEYFNDTGSVAASASQEQFQNMEDVRPERQIHMPNGIVREMKNTATPNKDDDDDKILGLNKWAFIGICAAAVLILGVGGYFLFRGLRKNGGVAPKINNTGSEAASASSAASPATTTAAPSIPEVK